MSNTKRNDIIHLNFGILHLKKIAFCDFAKESDVRFVIDNSAHYEKCNDFIT